MEIFFIQTGSEQGEVFALKGLMQGEQARKREMASWFVPTGPKSTGVSGPKSTRVGIAVVEAKWAGPESFVTRR